MRLRITIDLSRHRDPAPEPEGERYREVDMGAMVEHAHPDPGALRFGFQREEDGR